jgi:hypothetical protein
VILISATRTPINLANDGGSTKHSGQGSGGMVGEFKALDAQGNIDAQKQWDQTS